MKNIYSVDHETIVCPTKFTGHCLRIDGRMIHISGPIVVNLILIR